MRIIDILRIAIRMIRTNVLRSLLTVSGIAVAISLIVLLIGLGYGLQELTIGSIIHSKALLSLDVSPLPDKSSTMTPETLSVIKKIAGVRDLSPIITVSGELRANNKLVAVAITAVNKNYFEMEGVTLTKGQLFEDTSHDVIVSPATLQLLDLKPDTSLDTAGNLHYSDPNNINQSKTIDTVHIVGISDDEDPTLYIPISLIATEPDTKLSGIKVVAKDRDSVVSVQQEIIKDGFQADTLIETLDQARTIFNRVTIALTVFGLIALVVASIGMFNTLTIALLERTREIGIMKAIGIDDVTVKRLFLAESAIIGLMGGLGGVGFGLLIDNTAGLILNRIALGFGGSKLTIFSYPPFFLLGMVLFPILLSLVTGLYPAIRAARINPLRALKYE